MLSFFHKSFTYFRNILSLKETDVLLASFPKSGNTWVRFYLCNLINLLPENHFTDEAIGFGKLDKIMPELGKSNLIQQWPFKNVPRIVKTHLPYNFFFSRPGSILIIRNPRDVLVSYFRYETTRATPRFTGSLQEFIRHPKFGIQSWCRHYLLWGKKADLIIKYEDLKANELIQFEKINNYLKLSVNEKLLKKAIEMSSFETIKHLEETKGLNEPSRFSSDFRFTRSGETDQWKNMLKEEDLNYVNIILKNHLINIY